VTDLLTNLVTQGYSIYEAVVKGGVPQISAKAAEVASGNGSAPAPAGDQKPARDIDVRTVHRPGAPGAGSRPGGGPAAEPRFHRDRAHTAGLIHEGDGLAAEALESLDISLEAVRDRG